MTRHQRSFVDCRGAFLVEALVAVVVFSIALLGLASSIASAVHEGSAAQWRGEALDVAATTLAELAAEAPGGIVARYGPPGDGDGYQRLLARAARLPGVAADVNAPDVDIVDAASQRNVAISIYWQPAGDAQVHVARLGAAMALP
jgi:type IV pilus assembly protein PilV